MFKVLRRYMGATQWLYSLICLALVVVQVWFDLKLPDYMSEITTLVETEGSSMQDILTQGAFMLGCALGSMATSMVVGYFAAKVAAGLARTLRNGVYDQTMSYSMAEMNEFSSSSLINRATNDITQIQNLVAMGLQAIIKAPILAVWALCKIAGKSWQWTAATAVAVAILVIMLVITLVYAVPRFQRIQGLTDKLNRVTKEQLTGIRVVRAYNAERYQEDKFERANDEITDTNMVANRVMAIMNPGMTFINSALTLSIYFIGAFLIETATGSAARLSLFSEMVVFSNYAMQIIMAFVILNLIFVLLPRAQVSARRVLEVLDTKPSITDGRLITRENHKQPPERGTIEFRDVSFQYGKGGNVIEGISFRAEQGQTIAVIGATGSGKSTLIQLIPRLYDATAGKVLVDGVDVRDYSQEALRDRIGYCTQKAVMFSGTVTSNITYGDSGQQQVSDQDVRDAADISQSSEFLAKMEDGLDTHIAQGGTNVSGGQKQRLGIARALARKPEILVFDDSFSALDFKTDRELRHQLAEHERDVTKVIVAQRIGTIKDADQILVLDHGRLVGIGTHAQLMRSCRVYQEIAASQLSQAELDSMRDGNGGSSHGSGSPASGKEA